jgi:hypothetical protein
MPTIMLAQGLADRVDDVRVVRADAIAIALVAHRPAMPDQQRVIEQPPIQESRHIDGAIEQRIVHDARPARSSGEPAGSGWVGPAGRNRAVGMRCSVLI